MKSFEEETAATGEALIVKKVFLSKCQGTYLFLYFIKIDKLRARRSNYKVDTIVKNRFDIRNILLKGTPKYKKMK